MNRIQHFLSQRNFIQKIFYSTELSGKVNNVLVLNCGSSSIKFQVINPKTEKCLISGQADRLQSQQNAKLKYNFGNKDTESESLGQTTYETATNRIFELVSDIEFNNIGHRVVHGGEVFKDVSEINEETLHNLDKIKGTAFYCDMEHGCG